MNRWIAGMLILFGILLLPQFIISNPDGGDTKNDISAPEHIKVLLKNACYDCHSYETKYPYYSKVFPISLFIFNHIREGREELNFSEFENLSESKKSSRLRSLVEDIESGEMPLNGYTLMHPEAKWSEEEKQMVIEWAKLRGGDSESDDN